MLVAEREVFLEDFLFFSFSVVGEQMGSHVSDDKGVEDALELLLRDDDLDLRARAEEASEITAEFKSVDDVDAVVLRD